MRIYLWFITGMLIFLFFFILITMIIKAAKINIVFKIIRCLCLAIILALIYIMLTRVLGVFHFTGSEEWILDFSFLYPKVEEKEVELIITSIYQMI